jgi:hypothetical protein
VAVIRFFSSGYEVDESKFRDIERTVYRYATGQISGYRFEKLMRDLGITRALAFSIYRDVLAGRYERVVPVVPPPPEIEMVKYLISLSLVTTGESWRRRYFEIRSIIWVPSDRSVTGDVDKISELTCDDIDNMGDFILRLMYLYQESKGYDTPMLESANFKYSGIEELERMDYDEFWDLYEEAPLYMEIWDNGSDNRKLELRRWYDEFKLSSEYLYDYPTACKKFNKMARRSGYEKRFGKQVRWV